jgi:DNA mismatch repair protein MutS
MSKAAGDTPLMQQHRAIKQKYPDAILLFRVGDFYETFGEDAIKASQVLGITLTKRNNAAANSSELAGFPHHSLDAYLHKLVRAGHRVAICDQLEDPKQAKGIVKRGVTEMVTPGTTTNDKLLELGSNNFLCGMHMADDNLFGLAFLDVSTGEFFVAEGDREYADKLLQGFKPSEVVYQRHKQKNFKEYFGSRFYTYVLDEWVFQDNYATDLLLRHFQTHSLKGFGVSDLKYGLIAAGAVMHYLRDTEHPNLQHVVTMQRIGRDDFLWMDRFTIRNLELLGTGAEDGLSLLKTLDHTVSPMGARLLKRWMVFPLKDAARIEERLILVEFFIREVELRTRLIHHIKPCGDIERLVSKIPLKKINPREVLQISRGLAQVDAIKTLCANQTNDYLIRLADALNSCSTIAARIRQLIIENPPATPSRGGMINTGVSEELDELRLMVTDGKAYLLKIQQAETERTGISSLKIGFNNVFGYYLEVTHTHKEKVPADWIRKQTLTNAERYITPELKTYEEKIVGAEEKILQLETSIYDALLNELQDFLAPMQTNGGILATIDCMLSFASTALQYNYKKPQLTKDGTMRLTASRHPVIERNLAPGEEYVSNDIHLDKNEQQIIILTGPNMSGKSALLRQCALITLMTHMGSFVPASEAHVPLTDKIFTRVGASDNLSGGESTFMVEMNETASIINNVTDRSLVLLDEIGRGTSTYDGISIAWSIVEFLQQSSAKPLTLFATHYHELNELENRLPGVRNYHITNMESGNKIIFLRKLAPGGSKHSFGIHVARMAGMPPMLVNRANEILKQLESKHINDSLTEQVSKLSQPKMQLSIFDVHSETFTDIRQALDDIDINRLTPVEALLKLQEIKSKVK